MNDPHNLSDINPIRLNNQIEFIVEVLCSLHRIAERMQEQLDRMEGEKPDVD